MADYSNQKITFGNEVCYRLVTGDKPHAGVSKVRTGFAPKWIPFVLVDDIDKMYYKAKVLKAKPRGRKFVIFNIGEAVVMTDPTGATFGMIKSVPGAGKGK